jgi:hypothetical protein
MATNFSAQSKALDEIIKGMQRQTNAMAEIDKRLQAQSGILSCLTGKSEAHDNRLKEVSDSLATLETHLPRIYADSKARVQGIRKVLDTTTALLCNDVTEVRARLIPDLRHDMQSLDGVLCEAMTRLPYSMTSTPSEGDHTPATSDPVVGVATGTGLAPTGNSSAPAASKNPHVDDPDVNSSTPGVGTASNNPPVDGPNV